jgi:hypothetical protein
MTDHTDNWINDEPTTTYKYVRFATATIKTYDALRLRLRQVFDDPDFNFGKYRQPLPCRSMGCQRAAG